MDEIFLVWKIPDEDFDSSPYHDIGIYPTGELMDVLPTENEARETINLLRRGSPSPRFGDYQDSAKNSMDEAPYRFTWTVRTL